MADSQATRQIAKISDYKLVFNSPHGQRVLMDMMKNHRMLSSSFDSDPLKMALYEGERNVVLRILSMLKIDIQELHKRIEENSNERN